MARKKALSRDVETDTTWYASLPRSTRFPTIAGILVMSVMTAGFGVWGNLAPIAGAVVASGVFVATGQNKIIQHLEGGVIRAIHVREGDTVEQGQLLVLLDETAPRAELRRLMLRGVRLKALDARLQAEMREDPEVKFPMEIEQGTDAEIGEILHSQRMAFTARRNNVLSDIAGINESINALNERIQGSNVQLDAVKRQIVPARR